METVKKDFLADVMNALRLAGLPLTKAGLLKNMGMSKYGVDVKLDEALVELKADGRVSIIDEWGTPLYAASSVLNTPVKDVGPTEIELAMRRAAEVEARKLAEKAVREAEEARIFGEHLALFEELLLLRNRFSAIDPLELPDMPGPSAGTNEKVNYLINVLGTHLERYGDILTKLESWQSRWEASPFSKPGAGRVPLNAISNFRGAMRGPYVTYMAIPVGPRTVDAGNGPGLRAAIDRLDRLENWVALYSLKVESVRQQPAALRDMFKAAAEAIRAGERPFFNQRGVQENVSSSWLSYRNPYLAI